MYRVLIADDEAIIRNGLKRIVKWEEFGFKIAGEAKNGEIALTFLCNENPDIVLLDIRMPQISGLDLISRARTAGFTGKVIIISGYSDFNYAQQAIELGVKFYLTKPINKNELEQILQSLHKELDEETKKKNIEQQYIKHARTLALRDLLFNPSGISFPDFMEETASSAQVYQVVFYSEYYPKQPNPLYPFEKLLQINNSSNRYFEQLTLDNAQVILLKGKAILQKFGNIVQLHDSRLNMRHPIAPSLSLAFITYGCPVRFLTDAHVSYEDAAHLFSRRFFCAKNQHISGYKDEGIGHADNFYLDDIFLDESFNHILNHIHGYNRKGLMDFLEKLQNDLATAICSANDVRYFLTDLYLKIKDTICRVYSDVEIPFPANSWVMDFIQNKSYLFEIIQFMSEQFEMIMRCTGSYSRESVVEDIINYINHNYMENLRLEFIALLFGYNSSYLGKIFKQKMNCNFNTYLDIVRIENAKKLLEQGNLKVYEIAKKVGYTNTDYLHIKFKKYVGETPAEYRKKVRSDHDANT